MPENVVNAAQVYTEVCKSIRETDDISFKLIGLIPLFSGASILTFVGSEVSKSLIPVIPFQALFAAAITLALYRWELRNIQICNWQWERAKLLEKSVFQKDKDKRRQRPKSPSMFGKTEAAKCAYSITVLAWVFFPAATFNLSVIAWLSYLPNTSKIAWLSYLVDGGLNPRLSGGGAETGTNFAAELLAARVRGDRFLSTPQAAGGGGQRPAFTGIYRPAKIGRRDRWRCSIASSPTQNIQPSGALLGDKGYDADALIERLRDARIAVVIPPKSNRKDKKECDFILNKERNLIERLFGKLKQFRAIATRYDKLARNFLGAIRLVAAVIQLN